MAFRHQFIIPEFQEFSKDIELIYWKCKENTNGTVRDFSAIYNKYVRNKYLLLCFLNVKKLRIALNRPMSFLTDLA